MFELARFIAQYLGVPHTGDTVENAGQCVGLVEKWLDYNGKLHIWGNAVDLLKNADVRSYHIFHNTPLNIPPSGAIVVWDGTWGQGNGHCAVCIAANVHHMAVFQQNNPLGTAPRVDMLDYSAVQGWLTW